MTTMKSAPGSRLPVPKAQPTMPSDRGSSAPSKLEVLRQQYQQQIKRAKEEKLREMYYHNPPPSNKALLRINPGDEGEDTVDYQGGNVRDFFQQRRGGQGGGKKGTPNGYTQPNGYADSYKHRTQNKPPHIPPGAYKGVGRDKSKPLAPISRDSSSVSSATNGHTEHTGQTANTRAFTLDEHGKTVPFNKKAVKARGKNSGGQKNSQQNSAQQERDTDHGDGSNRRERPAAPSSGKKTRNFKEWQEEQKRKKENLERQAPDKGDQEPMSDYQKWQDTMDQDRDERLTRHREQQGKAPVRDTQKAAILHQQNAKHVEIPVESDDDEEDDRMSQARRQEQELQRQLEKQQRELERIRKERQREEEQERLREEADRKRRASLAAKQKRIQEQEAEARRREEEQDEKIRRLEEINNNNQKIIAQHSSRGNQKSDRPTSNRTYSVTSTRGDEYARDESPPSKYFPTKPVRPRSRKTSVNSVPSVRDVEQRNNYYNNQQQENSSSSKPKKQKYQPPKPKPPKATSHYYQEPEEEDDYGSPPKEDPTSFYIAAAEEAPTENLNLVPCSSCGRKFAEDRLAKHSKACVAKKKTRKPMDPSKMRTAGTDMAKYQHKSGREEPKKPKADWRRKREDFINTIRYARAAQKAEETGAALPPPPPSDTSHLKQCPHCGRKFNESAADRHIPGCQKRKEQEAMRGPPKGRRR